MKLRSKLLFMVALLLSLNLRAQTPGEGTIEGVVVDAASGTPVASAPVRILQNFVGTIKELRTDANGKFSATGIVPGAYVIAVNQRGFAAEMASANVRAGSPSDSVRIQLKRPGVITGRVLDENKRPRSGMEVMAVTSFYTNGGRVLSEAGDAETDDRGEYRISGLVTGDYYIIARRSSLDRVASTPTLYPGVLDFATASRITVAAGSEMRAADFALASEKAFKISLRTVRPVEWPQAPPRESGFGMVDVLPRGRLLPQHWQTMFFHRSATGDYTSDPLPPGTYDLYVRMDDNTKQETPADIQKYAACGHAVVTIADKDVDAGDLKVQLGISVPGRIVFKDQRPADYDMRRLRIVPTTNMRCYLTGQVSVDADGAFTLPNLPRGNVRLRIEGLPEGFYVDSVRFGAREILDSGMTIEDGSNGQLEVTVMTSGGVVEGIARDARGQAVAGSVVLVPPPERRQDQSNFRTALADKAGMFRITGLRSGEYRLLRWDGGAPEYLDPDVLKNYENLGVRVLVQRGAVTSAGDVRAIPK